MGKIVGAFCTAHILMKRGSGGDAGERVFAGMKEIGERVRAVSPDIIVIVSSDHFYNFHAEERTRIAVAPNASHTPFGDMDVPTVPFPGAETFARGLEAYAAGKGVALGSLENYRPDHGVMVPALVIAPDRSIPIVPVITNTGHNSPPSFREGYELGLMLREFVQEKLANDVRVVVVGTGGLSHWLGVPQMGRINGNFDRRVLDGLAVGNVEDIASWSIDEVLAEGGNGGLEVVNWLVAAAAAGSLGGQQIYYEPVAEWITGMGGMELAVAGGRDS